MINSPTLSVKVTAFVFLGLVATHASSAKLDAEARAAVIAQAEHVLSRGCQRPFKLFLNSGEYSAFFYSMDKTGASACGWTENGATEKEASAKALAKCNEAKQKKAVTSLCKLLAVNNRLVRGADDFPLAEGAAGLKAAINYSMISRMMGFVENGIDVNTATEDGNTALKVVAAMGEYDTYKDLLSKGADRSIGMDNGSNLLIAAVVGGNMNIIRDALDNNISPNQPGVGGNTPLHAAMKTYSYYAAHVLIQAGGDPELKNDNGESVVSILASSDKDLSELESEYNFFNAAKNNDLPAMRSIFESLSADERTESLAKKVMFVKGTEASTYSYLLEKGANPNQRDYRDTTPLIQASTYNEIEIANLLLKAGADKTAVDGEGKSALDYAETESMRAMLQ